ncbi:nucleotidyl transferase AbiEii/AbiGii toxin family protein [Granulicella sibirica]|uniref:Abortive infection protein AbiGII n=1 Tax=Granulicella sibirica TaxID=2479048 RepID=A0A4Q0SXL5_9BACT|nr:nucleotidyl transferase AbiEii/AbiGii toxin family protein [Granulicella sibirica]RXH55895.1 Abortive infection protein AbiGII [Granulicella sibirica]
MSKPVTNVAASVRQRLLNLARERKEDFGLLLTKYALERLLFRISQSQHKTAFILKGALLFELWTEQTHRPTRDADFLSIGSSDPRRFEAIFKEICALPVADDGLVFDASSVTARQIKEGADYEGVRVSFLGYLEKARIPMQIDIGFGDAVTPAAVETAFPTILDGPAAVLLTYPRETVVAEKFEAMVKLGIANTRMKDFHDLRTLAQLFPFEGRLLSEAIMRTFERRKTALPSAPPIAFTAEFFEDKSKQLQWNAFNERNRLYVEAVPLKTVLSHIERFLMPLVLAMTTEGHWSKSWQARGPWQD